MAAVSFLPTCQFFKFDAAMFVSDIGAVVLITVEGALVQRPLDVVALAEGPVDLELEDEGGKVLGVGGARGHVVLAAGVKVRLGAGATG